MADQKISELTALTSATDDDLLAIVDDPAGTPVTKKITVANLATSHGHATLTSEWVGGGTDTAINSTTFVDIVTITTDLAAGDYFVVDMDYLILNDSASTRTYTWAIDFNGLVAQIQDGATIAQSSTARMAGHFRAAVDLRTTSLVYIGARNYRGASQAADTSASAGTLSNMRSTWNTSASDLTGSSKSIKLQVKSSSATATQTFTLLSYRVRRL